MNPGAAHGGWRRRIEACGFSTWMQRTQSINRHTKGIDHTSIPALIGKETQGIGAINSFANAGKGHGVEGLNRRSLLLDTHGFRELGKAACRKETHSPSFKKRDKPATRAYAGVTSLIKPEMRMCPSSSCASFTQRARRASAFRVTLSHREF